jgi:hypothetical protein
MSLSELPKRIYVQVKDDSYNSKWSDEMKTALDVPYLHLQAVNNAIQQVMVNERSGETNPVELTRRLFDKVRFIGLFKNVEDL